MARPTKQGMDYFPHDTDASSDEKVDALRMIYGNDGYAFYFILLERIYRTVDFELDVSDAETIQILARKVEVTPEKFAEMLQTSIKRKCFCQKCYTERGVLTSPGIKNRASTVVNKRQKMASSYQQRQGNNPNPNNQGVSVAETTPETGVSDELPSRVKGEESKVNESIVNIPPSPSPREESSFEEKKIGGDAEKTNISGDSYFHYCNELKGDRQFIESTCMSLKISREQLPELLDQFTHEQRALRKTYKEYADFKGHSFNWLRTKAVYLNSQSQNNARSTPSLAIPPRNSGNSGSARAALGQGADLTGIVYVQESFKPN